MASNLVKSIVNKAFKFIGENLTSGVCPIWVYSADMGTIRKTAYRLEASKTAIMSLPASSKNLTVNFKSSSKKPLGTVILTKDAALKYAKVIDNLHTGADHLNIKNDSTWQYLYLYQKRSMAFEAPDGAGKISYNINSVPCHHCGIIMPADAIQVDHYMPQAQSPDLYAIKTLRALGMTVGKATGWKGYNLDRGASEYGLDFKVYPTGRPRGDMSHLLNGTNNAKWKTNAVGDAFLSLMAASGDMASFKRLCKNSLLNLMPLCSHCNQRKSDQIRPIV